MGEWGWGANALQPEYEGVNSETYEPSQSLFLTVCAVEQTLQGSLPVFNEIFGLDLDVSLDTFDGFLLDFDSILGSGAGLPSIDDVITYELFRLLFVGGMK